MKLRPRIVNRILDVIDTSTKICVVSHIRPDGDSLGSQLALTFGLEKIGKQVEAWCDDPIPAKLSFLDPENKIQKPHQTEGFDCVISVDVASVERLGECRNYINSSKVLINIDHHSSNTRFGDINWICPRDPATGEIVFKLFKWARWEISTQIADCLFTAISTDTGSFQYSTTRPTTFRTAAELVQRGAELEKICNSVYQSFPISRVRLLQLVLNRFKLTADNKIAYFWLKPEDFTRTGACISDSEGLIDHIRSIEPVVVACLFELVKPDLIRISLRSKSQSINVNEIAAKFNGGGHPAAAGAHIQGTPLAVQRKVIKAIKQALNSNYDH